ncbi:hypothetical protein I4F81_002107 [Pyropia yezoensis]|uniref:Uncharacterized protein n=1 Tax=Pyropia yezoensis TaxID=2788 RepID=A0ACC3BPU4_PYRYE|nr:hypothetical protein I4F81_002107 [Neopyropia yezoensis]
MAAFLPVLARAPRFRPMLSLRRVRVAPARAAVMTLRVCRKCKQQYDTETNTPASCRTHSAQYRGRLNRIEPTETSGLEYFWHCCGETDRDAPGCALSVHASYDDA